MSGVIRKRASEPDEVAEHANAVIEIALPLDGAQAPGDADTRCSTSTNH